MSGNEEFSALAQALLDKSLTKKELLIKVKADFHLIPLLLEGVAHQKAAVRYGCSKVLMDLSEENPEKLYPHFDFFHSAGQQIPNPNLDFISDHRESNQDGHRQQV